MTRIDLEGEWTLSGTDCEGSGLEVAATVPGVVHQDLLRSGKIPDPYVGDHERHVQWVGEADWTYRRTFRVTAAVLEAETVRLCADGIDTLATARVNGEVVGRADNMYRRWRWDVRDLLREGENTLEVAFRSPLPVLEAGQADRELPEWRGALEPAGRGHVRKSPATFGWDWGPVLITQGIWRPIWIEATDVRIENVHVRQTHHESRVDLEVAVALDRSAPLRAECHVTLDGLEVGHATADLEDGTGTLALEVEDPALWWPNGMGGQPLYSVRVSVLEGDDEIDVWERQIGLRTLRLVTEPDEWGESFHFEANGVPFFAKGANWIPADALIPRTTDAQTAGLLEAAADAHMNMVRVWGGGVYETDAFYDACDRLGLCVWQDFMFACSAYPSDDAAFRESVGLEAQDQVRRLRHHASLALWCGNNEIEQGLVGDEWVAPDGDNDGHMAWADYDRLFNATLPDVVTALDPDTDYWPGSPHSPGNRADFNDPTRGDAHLWDVWHGKKPFEWYRTCEHRFCSEFGFQSFPDLETVESFTDPEDRNVTSYVMELHQRSPPGNALILHYLLDWFRLPTDFGQTLRLTQVLQGLAMQYAVEHWRRSMPRGMGTLYWQLNDCWPVASWSSLDYYGRWKALHHLARRFYALLLVSGVEDGPRVELHVTSDRLEDVEGAVVWTLTNLEGGVVRQGREAVTATAGSNTPVGVLDATTEVEEHTERGMILWLAFEVDGATVARNLVLFARPKHLALPDPQIEVRVEDDGDTCQVVLEAARPALWATLALEGVDAWFSDNVVHLRPGDPQTITVRPEGDLTVDDVRDRLRVQSLVDTYS